MEARKLYTTKQIAEMYGLKPNTVKWWREARRYDLRYPPYTTIGRSVYCYADEFAEALKTLKDTR